MGRDPKRDKTIYRHRDLPPLNAEAIGEHVIEATSARVPRCRQAETNSGAAVARD
jgi:hypothetical protein